MPAAESIESIELIGTASIPHSTKAGGWPVGGLSGLTRDRRDGSYWAVSDDRSEHGPARLVHLSIAVSSSGVSMEVLGAVPLGRVDETSFPVGSIDAEGITATVEGTLVVSSEGDASKGVQPFVREFDTAGRELAVFPLPARYLLDGEGRRGVRDNLGFEALSLGLDSTRLLLATENALVQDGPRAGLAVGSPVRILTFDRASAEPLGEVVYWTEPIAQPPWPASGFAVNGLSSILALDSHRVLALERSFSDGRGLTVRLFEVDLAGASDVSGIEPLERQPVVAASKRLVLDFGSARVPLDNYEGLSWGPDLPDGRRTLLVLSDDNFSALQRTMVAAFAVATRPPSIAEIQGQGPRSPLAGRCGVAVEGVVAAVREGRSSGGFWVVGAGGRGLFVADLAEAPRPAPGARVEVVGCVEERAGRDSDPWTTTLVPSELTVAESTGESGMPAAIVIGGEVGRPSRWNVDDDAGRDFDPASDALDFWNALEGSLVAIPDPLVVGALDGFGQLAIVGDGGRDSGARTPRGGLIDSELGSRPHRLVIAPSAAGLPAAKVGDRLGPVTGIVEYRFGSWRLVPAAPVEIAASAPWRPQPAQLGRERFTVASYNVLNLSARSDKQRFDLVAESIVRDLGSPAVVGLQEIQDDSGPQDDGTTTSTETLGRLVDAILGAGGPRYEAWWRDPEDNADGGQPGGNIRVAALVDPLRATVIEREGDGFVEPVRIGDGAGPSASPGRLFVDHPAFAVEDGDGGTRKPLVLELEMNGHRLVVVVCHLASKSGDDAVIGRIQPPRRPTERRRIRQALAIVEWVQQLLALDPQANAIVLGDFNDFPARPAIRLLADAGPLVRLEPPDPATAYSFNWLGVVDQLDHAFVTPALAEQARPRIEIVHTNVDLPAPQAVSDHDPVLIALDLPEPPE